MDKPEVRAEGSSAVHHLARAHAVLPELIDDEECAWRALGCTGNCRQGRSVCDCGVDLRRAAHSRHVLDSEYGVPLDRDEWIAVVSIIGLALIGLLGILASAMGWLP